MFLALTRRDAVKRGSDASARLYSLGIEALDPARAQPHNFGNLSETGKSRALACLCRDLSGKSIDVFFLSLATPVYGVPRSLTCFTCSYCSDRVCRVYLSSPRSAPKSPLDFNKTDAIGSDIAIKGHNLSETSETIREERRNNVLPFHRQVVSRGGCFSHCLLWELTMAWEYEFV